MEAGPALQEKKRKPGTFPPGVSGNPSGKPKGAISLTTQMRRLLKEAVKEGSDKRKIQILAEGIFLAATKGNAALAKEIWERIDGKVPQPIEHTGKDGGPIEISTLTEEGKRKRLAALLREEAKNGISD